MASRDARQTPCLEPSRSRYGRDRVVPPPAPAVIRLSVARIVKRFVMTSSPFRLEQRCWSERRRPGRQESVWHVEAAYVCSHGQLPRLVSVQRTASVHCSRLHRPQGDPPIHSHQSSGLVPLMGDRDVPQHRHGPSQRPSRCQDPSQRPAERARCAINCGPRVRETRSCEPAGGRRVRSRCQFRFAGRTDR